MHSCKTGRETKRMVEESCSEYCQLRKSSTCRQANPPYAVHGSKEWAVDRTPRSIRKRFPVSGTKVPDKPIPTDNKWAPQCSWIWSTEHIQGPEARRPCSRCCSLVLGRLKLSRRSRLTLVPQTVTQVMRGVILSVRTSAGAMVLLYNTHMRAWGPRGRGSLDNRHSAPGMGFDIDRQLQNSALAHGVRNPRGCRIGIQYANISTVAVCQSL